ncbi:uncharacterized protein LOC126990373, partial [Eriocheir sinensis]|uniref:uncharacterized protein LOC126990373 n=1 Tax=Eriocheir sinensis TaxID=95602 RepID=UPI0021C75FB3
MEVLGVTYDSKMTFRTHIERLAREASGKLASLRRMSWLLDGRGLEVLYKSQIRSSLEYACLAWGGAAHRHLAHLNRVQDRAERLIRSSSTAWDPQLQPLQHRRDVAGLTVMFQVQQLRQPHLQELYQQRRRNLVTTRAVVSAPEQLLQPRSRTWHYQRQFLYTYVGLWNTLLASQQNLERVTLQGFKECAHQWLMAGR